jgi:FkbM family methyltransferase
VNLTKWREFIHYKVNKFKILIVFSFNSTILYLKEKLGKNNGEYIISTRYGNFFIRSGMQDIFIIQHLVVDEVYTRYERIKDNDIVLDLGGHIGGFTIYALKKGATRLIAVEPNKENFGQMKKNIKLNHLKEKVVLIKRAVWDKKEYIYLKNDLDCSGRHTAIEERTSNKVMGITLGELINTYQPSFLKCDVEGAEYKAFLNTPVEKFSGIRYIALEYHENQDVRDLEKFLMNAGYSLRRDGSQNPKVGMLYAKVKKWRK